MKTRTAPFSGAEANLSPFSPSALTWGHPSARRGTDEVSAAGGRIGRRKRPMRSPGLGRQVERGSPRSRPKCDVTGPGCARGQLACTGCLSLSRWGEASLATKSIRMRQTSPQPAIPPQTAATARSRADFGAGGKAGTRGAALAPPRASARSSASSTAAASLRPSPRRRASCSPRIVAISFSLRSGAQASNRGHGRFLHQEDHRGDDRCLLCVRKSWRAALRPSLSR